MEILNIAVVENSGFVVAFLVLTILFGIVAILTEDSERKFIPYGCIILAIIMFILFFTTALGITLPATEKKYTVEITSNEAYQWLIENGYDIQKRVYESKDIYKICGAPLPDLEWIIPLN